MKMIVTLLFTLSVGFATLAQTPQLTAPIPQAKIIADKQLYDLMTAELTVERLRKVYSRQLRVSKITPNPKEPAVQDTFLLATDGGDKLRIRSNVRNSSLLIATFNSPRLAYGKGIRVGASRQAFCNAFELPSGYDNYVITTTGDEGRLYFIFRGGILTNVLYDSGNLN